MKIERRTIAIDVRAETKGRAITGMIPYGSESLDLGGFTEILEPGCFERSLGENDRIMSFWGHDDKQPLGSTESGTLELRDSPEGLHFTISPPNNSWGNGALESIKRGDVNGCSFGFRVPDGGETWEQRDGLDLRRITDADLIEVSPTSLPAYPKTSVDVRSKTMFGKKKIADLYNAANEIRNRSEGDKALTQAENAEFLSIMQRHDELAPEHGVPLFTDCGFEGVRKYWESSENDGIKPGFDETETRHRQGKFATDELRVWDKYLVKGMNSLNIEERTMMEERAIQADKDTQAGFLIMPEQHVQKLIKALDDETFVMKYADITTMETAQTMGTPYLAEDPDDDTWTAEIGEISEDSSLSFEKRELSPHPLSKLLKVSNKLLRATGGWAGRIVEDRLRYKTGITIEKSCIGGSSISGQGVGQPLGLFTISENGIDSSRDISAGNLENTIGADNLLEVEDNLRMKYRDKARWIFGSDFLKKVRLLKDGEGRYIWNQGLQGAPNRLLDHPYDVSSYAPNTYSSSKLVAVLGDLSYYHIAIALDMEIQVLKELFARNSQTGYVIRSEIDGMPVLAEAFSRSKLS